MAFLAAIEGIALLLILAGSAMMGRTLWFRRHSRRTKGTVVEIDDVGSGSRGACCYPIVEYTAEDGTVQEFRSEFPYRQADYQEGQQVTIYVDRTDPAVGQIQDLSNFINGGILIGIGLAILWLATEPLITAIKQ